MADNAIEKKPSDLIEDVQVPKVLLDTNVILAYLNEKNQWHQVCHTAVEGLKGAHFTFVIPWFVIGELLCHRDKLGLGHVTVEKALKSIDNFQKHLGNQLMGGKPLNLKSIFDRFKRHGRKRKFNTQHFSDFAILTEVEDMKNIRVITCDKDMYYAGQCVFGKKIYYLPNKSRGMKSQLPRLIKESLKL